MKKKDFFEDTKPTPEEETPKRQKTVKKRTVSEKKSPKTTSSEIKAIHPMLTEGTLQRIKNAIAAARRAGKYDSFPLSLTGVCTASLIWHVDEGHTLTQKMGEGRKRGNTIRLSETDYKLWLSLPSRLRSEILDRAILSYLVSSER